MDIFKTIKFTDGDFSLDVRVSVEDGTIWLSAGEIAKLFDVNPTTIRRYINATYIDNKKTLILSKEKNANNALILHLSHKTKPVTLYNSCLVIELENQFESSHLEAFKLFVFKKSNNSSVISKNQIVIFDNGVVSLDVNISPKEETVWLTQAEISTLFETTISNVSMHIKNILKDGELESNSVIKDFLNTGSDGKQYFVQQYNLDMILSIGYRIKGNRAIEFRKWASKVLSEYLFKGYVINEDRVSVTADNILRLENEIYELKNKIQTIEKGYYLAKEKIIFKGEVFDAYELISSIISKASNNIKIIDPYFD